MNMDEALQFVETLLAQRGHRLNDLERKIFQGAWQGKSYKEIHRVYDLGISLEHMMRNVGPTLWKHLRDAVGEPIRMKDLQGPIQRAYAAKAQAVLPAIASSFVPSMPSLPVSEPRGLSLPQHRTQTDWGMAPDVGIFCGRDRDIAELQERIELDRCRLIFLLGIAGIGKTCLGIRLGQHIAHQGDFDAVIWRSLTNQPSLNLLLEDLLQTLQELLPGNPPWSSNLLLNLWYYLRNYRCLILLDGLERLLPSGSEEYSAEYEAYGSFLRRLGEAYHNSCVILTSRERPQATSTLAGSGDSSPVYYYWLEELGEESAREMLASKFDLSGSDRDWSLLIRLYVGNPLALNAAASQIQDLYAGAIDRFLAVHATETAIFGEIRQVLEQQLAQLSRQEQIIVDCLARIGEPMPRTRILTEVTAPLSNEQLDQCLQKLLWRSLLVLENFYYMLHPLVQKYAQGRLGL